MRVDTRDEEVWFYGRNGKIVKEQLYMDARLAPKTRNHEDLVPLAVGRPESDGRGDRFGGRDLAQSSARRRSHALV